MHAASGGANKGKRGQLPPLQCTNVINHDGLARK